MPIRKTDDDYRLALRRVFLTEERPSPKADLARRIIDAFIAWLNDHGNLDANNTKLSALAPEFLHDVWGIDTQLNSAAA